MTQLDKVSKAISRTMIRQIFYGSCIAATPVKFSDAMPTAWTDALSIYYNKDFVDGITSDETEGVFVHEVLHIVLLHGPRRGNRKPMIWNVACDHVINLRLLDDGYKLPAGGCYDPQYKNMCEEDVYEKLIDDHHERMKDQQMMSQQSGDGDGDNDESGGSGEPTRGDAEEDLEKLLSGTGGPLGGDIQMPESMDEADIAKVRAEAMGRLSQAVTMARAAGQLSAGMEGLIASVFEPELPWTTLLARYATEVVQSREDWGRPNRRVQSVFLPRMYDTAMGDFIVIGDASGSVTQREKDQIAAEVTEVAETVKPKSIHVIWADTEVAGEQVFERGEPIDITPRGGGGTDMRVPLEYAEQFEPVVCVLVTDGYTPWPDEAPPYPLIVCCTSDIDVPEYLGEVIRLRAGG